MHTPLCPRTCANDKELKNFSRKSAVRFKTTQTRGSHSSHRSHHETCLASRSETNLSPERSGLPLVQTRRSQKEKIYYSTLSLASTAPWWLLRNSSRQQRALSQNLSFPCHHDADSSYSAARLSQPCMYLLDFECCWYVALLDILVSNDEVLILSIAFQILY